MKYDKVKKKHNYVEYYNYERNISVAYFIL